MSPDNFDVNERPTPAPFRLSCHGTIRHARDGRGELRVRVPANSCGILPFVQAVRSVALARSPGSCRLFPVSLHGEPFTGSRLNHLLRRTTAPRHHLGPRDVQANRVTRKFRTLLRVFHQTLFSFPFLVTPRRWAPSSICQLGTMYRRSVSYAKQFSEFIPLRRRLLSCNVGKSHDIALCNKHKEKHFF